jgi:c-di-GMP-binding flagellar brake protein YcgR
MMPSRLNKWFKREPKAVLTPAQQLMLVKLQEWQREHRKLSVSITGDNQTYQSLIVTLQPEKNCFLIDEFFPLFTGPLSLVGQEFKVSLREHGRDIYFQCHCFDEAFYQGLPAYSLSIPQHFIQTQRRRGFRALIAGHVLQNEVTVKLVATQMDAQSAFISAWVKDISIWGIGLIVHDDLREKMNVGLHSVANIMIQDLLNAEVFLEIKNIRYDEKTAMTTLGCVFLSMDPALQKQLHKKIIEIQRLQMRQLHNSHVV